MFLSAPLVAIYYRDQTGRFLTLSVRRSVSAAWTCEVGNGEYSWFSGNTEYRDDSLSFWNSSFPSIHSNDSEECRRAPHTPGELGRWMSGIPWYPHLMPQLCLGFSQSTHRNSAGKCNSTTGCTVKVILNQDDRTDSELALLYTRRSYALIIWGMAGVTQSVIVECAFN